MQVGTRKFIPPHGRSVAEILEVSDDPERQRKYAELTVQGCEITTELLRLVGHWSVCISCDEVDDDFVMQVSFAETTPIEEAVAQTIDEWDEKKFLRWKHILLHQWDGGPF